MSTVGRSVRLFLVEGNPGGIITAEVVNWTGHALVAPRSKLADVLTRAEAQKTGVYFLFGELAELGGKRPVYIGESDNVGKRLSQHVRAEQKEFERFCLITSKDLNLTKAHARYLENRLSNIARESDRSDVLNAVEPAQGILPEGDTADMEYFIEQVRLILPVLGYDVLKERFVRPGGLIDALDPDSDPDSVPISLKLRPSRKGLSAEAVERDGELLVLKDSLADKNPDYATNQYQPLRDRLEREGTLVPDENGRFLRFTKDTLFSSPSAAAAVIYGRNANGRTSWLLADMNKTLKDYQDQLQAAE